MKFISPYIILLFSLAIGYTQPSKILLDFPEDTLHWEGMVPPDSLLLPHSFIPENSVRIYTGSFKLLPGIHYRVDGRKGIVYFLIKIPLKQKTLRIIYRYPPFPLITSRVKALAVDSTQTAQRIIYRNKTIQTKRSDLLEDLYDETLQLKKSGSLVRGFQIGNNQDLTLNSGLNLQLSGYITPKVKIVAALTDQSTPIQPEGNTATLREVDRVFVRLEAPRIGGTLGDFNLNITGGQFGRVERKLQGLTMNGTVWGSQITTIYGTSRGTYHTNRFLGQEGHQGPYQLRGKNGEREIVVLAGTERVYVDGQLMQRGENNDYIIDYGLAQVTFTRNRLITSENQIEIDFEYTSFRQQFSKNFAGFQWRSRQENRPLFYDLRVFREWDDLNNPLDGAPPLNDEQKTVLKLAGDDPLKAATSGVEFVGQGNGNYVQRDTVIAGSTYRYFKYVGDGLGDFRIAFSGVGPGKGDYVRERIGIYRYVGPGRGDYLPLRLLPLPSQQLFVNLQTRYQLGKHVKLEGEFAISQRDENVFSPIGDEDNQGGAWDVRIAYQPSARKTSTFNWQQLALGVHLRRRDATFQQMTRQFQPLYEYRWNTVNPLTSNREDMKNLQFQWQPTTTTWLKGEWGINAIGGSQESQRQRLEGQIQQGPWPGVAFLRELILTRAKTLESQWLRQSVQLWLPWKRFKPEYRWQMEDRWLQENDRSQTGFFFTNHQLKVTIGKLFAMNWQTIARLREDYLYHPDKPGMRLKQATTRTIEIGGKLLKNRHWSGNFSFAFRDKQYTPFFLRLSADSIAQFRPDARFQDTTWQNRQSHLGRIALRYRSGGRWEASVDYRASSELEALKEKVYVFVGQNRGNYRFDETLQEYVPDPNGDYVLFIVPTNRFQNATLLEGAFRYRLRPGRVLRGDAHWKRFWKDISLNGYVRVDEQNRNPQFWRIYLLDWRAFQDPNFTLRGQVTMNQDIYYKERNSTWGLVFRSRYRQSLFNQFLDNLNNEQRIYWSRSIQLRRRFQRGRYTLTLGAEQITNRRIVAAVATRNRDILSRIINAGLVYRPVYRWQFELKVQHGWEQNRHPDNLLADRFVLANMRVTYSVKSKARIFFNSELVQVTVTKNPFGRPVPYEMGKGKKEGISYNISLRMDYFVNKHVTVTAAYTGRMDAGFLRPIHLGQAEIRAYF